jgi:GntR family transcriptional repressor for pyruvate dehydrogenase complex
MGQPVRRQGKLAARIVSQIEELIAARRLASGDQLPTEREMAALLRVSRPSLREAIRILEARGRLVVRHGRGVFLGEGHPDPAAFPTALRAGATELTERELLDMREALEVSAAAWAAERISETQLTELRSALDEMTALAHDADPSELTRLDTRFHLTVANAANNRFLRHVMGVLLDLTRPAVERSLAIPGRVVRSWPDHERIYAALRAHDPTAAGNAVRAHIRAARTVNTINSSG